MAGTDDDLAIGRGTNGASTRGTREGGGGEHAGLVGGEQDIDTGHKRGRRCLGGVGPGCGIPPKKERKLRIAATVAPRPSDLEGFCRPSQIGSVVRAHAGGIRHCYEKALQLDLKLAGKVTLRWRIDAHGRTRFPAVIASTLPAPRVGECLARIAQRWIFQKPTGGECVVDYPFVFKSGH